jgi:hypothetical protein
VTGCGASRPLPHEKAESEKVRRTGWRAYRPLPHTREGREREGEVMADWVRRVQTPPHTREGREREGEV